MIHSVLHDLTQNMVDCSEDEASPGCIVWFAIGYHYLFSTTTIGINEALDGPNQNFLPPHLCEDVTIGWRANYWKTINIWKDLNDRQSIK